MLLVINLARRREKCKLIFIQESPDFINVSRYEADFIYSWWKMFSVELLLLGLICSLHFLFLINPYTMDRAYL